MADNMLQIHELVSLGRDLADTDVLAVDTGALTAKVDYGSLKQEITDGDVKFSAAQTLTDAQKAQARGNIGAASAADLAAEAAAREQADEALQDAIDAEAAAREQADEALQDAIDAETEAREVADEAINESLATKADADGSYDEMIVGSAEQLISTELTEEKVPYTLRASGGAADIGNRETDMLVGGTIAWNQLANPVDGTTVNNGVTYTRSGGKVTVSGTATADSAFNLNVTQSAYNHIVFLRGCPSGGSTSTYFMRNGYMASGVNDTGNGIVFRCTSANGIIPQLKVINGTTANNLVFTPQAFDLTRMFGAAVADYIYSLEQATAGAGVAWFRALFRGDYYAYNAGELMSVQAASHTMVGFNQLDSAASSQGGTYRFLDVPIGKTNLLYMAFADKDTSVDVSDCNVGFCTVSGNPIGSYRWVLRNGAIQSDHSNAAVSGTAGELCRYVMVYPSNADAWDRLNRRFDICVNLSDPARNGEYEPYALHAYPLDDTLTLRGIPKLDANNALVYDGDTYASDGTVTRKYGVRAYQSGDESDGTVITDMTNTVYPLATTATETAATYRNPQIVDPSGTEEYVDAAVAAGTRDVAVPVGHVTQYMADLRGKLQKIPNLPTAGGTYVLKVTVTGGMPTYSWQAQ